MDSRLTPLPPSPPPPSKIIIYDLRETTAVQPFPPKKKLNMSSLHLPVNQTTRVTFFVAAALSHISN